MMQLVPCTFCGGTIVGLGNTMVNVVFTTHVKCCEHCDNIRKDETDYFFCSVECFDKWCKKRLKKGIK